jgi:uncharacterized protein
LQDFLINQQAKALLYKSKSFLVFKYFFYSIFLITMVKRKLKSYFCLISLAIICIFTIILFLAAGCSNDNGAIISENASAGQNAASDKISTADTSLPQYESFVNDFTGTISSEWLSKTEALTQDVEANTTCEIGVAVIDNLGGLTIEDYAFQLFNQWGIGKEDKDNGVLLLVSMDERQLRIEVGYGLEPIITDIEAKSIIDDVIVPAFKQSDYGPGIYNGVAAIANIIYVETESGASPVKYEKIAAPKKPFVETWGFPFLIIFANVAPWLAIGIVFLSVFLKGYIREHKCPKCKRIGLVITRKWLIMPTYTSFGRQEVTSICKYCDYYEKKTVTVPMKYRGSSSGSYSSFSSGSHSSSSSSSHSSSSFGGGSSGGGGASGSW